jgi:hypothetical protein
MFDITGRGARKMILWVSPTPLTRSRQESLLMSSPKLSESVISIYIVISLQESVYESTADHEGSRERWQEPKPGIVREDYAR